MSRGYWSVGCACSLVLLAVALPAAKGVDIDFEGFAEGTQISEQYCSSLGVAFSIIGNPNARPIIAVQGCPYRAFDGGGADCPCTCPQHDKPTDGVACLTDPLVGGMGPPNYAVGQSIAMSFHPPISSIRLHVIDIDNQDTVTVRALSGEAVVAEVTKSSGQPGTGNTVSTPFDLAGDSITRVEVLVPPVIGYAIDAMSFTRPTCPVGDVNGDCQLDAGDVEFFVNVLLGVDTECAHVAAADMNGSGTADGADVQPFVNAMLGS